MSMDAELLERYRTQGDRDALNELLGRHYPHVYQVALRLVHNEFDARDVAQSVFLKAIRSVHQVRNPRAFRSWLLKITVNEVRGGWRKQQRAPHLEQLFGEIVRTQPATQSKQASRREFELALENTLESMPPELKAPLVLRYYQALSLSEIAEILELPKSTAQFRLQRGVRRLRRRFGRKRLSLMAPYLSEISIPGTASALVTVGGLFCMKTIMIGVGAVAVILGVLLFLLKAEPPSFYAPSTAKGETDSHESDEDRDSPPKLTASTTSETTSQESSETIADVVTTTGPGVIGGVVLAEARGHPVSHARVVVRYARHHRNNWVTDDHPNACANVYSTDRNGEFRCHELPVDRVYDLHVSHPDFGYVERCGVTLSVSSQHVNMGVVELPEQRALRGIVRDVNGTPVAGVNIYAGDYDRALPMLSPTLSSTLRRGVTTTSDRHGKFTLHGLAPGFHRLLAMHPGYASTVRSKVFVPRTAKPAHIDVTLNAVNVTSGLVLDEQKHPIANALIIVNIDEFFERGSRGFSYRHHWSRIQSDERGIWRVTDFPADGPYTVSIRIEKEGYQPKDVEYIGLGSKLMPVTLTSSDTKLGTVVSGTIVDDRGALVDASNGQVWLVSVDKPRIAGTFDSLTSQYSFEGIAPGLYSIHADLLGYRRGIKSDVRVASSPLPDIRVSVLRGLTLNGRILDAKTDEPIPGAQLIYRGFTIHADTMGAYELGGLSSGRTTVGAIGLRAAGYFDASPSYFAPKDARHHTLDFKMIPVDEGITVLGKIVDAFGKPIAGAHVRYKTVDGVVRSVSAFSKRDGSFEFPPQKADALESTVTLMVTHSRFAPLEVGVPKAEAHLPNTVVLNPGRSVAGTVKDSRGKRVSHAHVTAVIGRVPTRLKEGAFDDREVASAREIGSVLADARGDFVIEHLPSEALTLLVTGTRVRYTMGKDHIGHVIAKGASDVVGVSVPIEREQIAEGVVVYGDGTPAHDVSLRASSTFAWTPVREDGSFRIDGIYGRGAQLKLNGVTVRPRVAPIEVADQPMRIVVDRCGIVHGTVGLSDRIRAGADVVIERSDGVHERAPLQRTGAFRFTRVLPGDYVLRLGQIELAVKVKAGETTDLGALRVEK